MSEKGLRPDAAEALAGARRLSAAGRDFAAQRDHAGVALAAASAAPPWGRDDAGRAFDRRYRPVERQVLDAWEQLAAYVESLGEAAGRSVRDTFGADASTPGQLYQAYGQEP
jgi:hypothetical protein